MRRIYKGSIKQIRENVFLTFIDSIADLNIYAIRSD